MRRIIPQLFSVQNLKLFTRCHNLFSATKILRRILLSVRLYAAGSGSLQPEGFWVFLNQNFHLSRKPAKDEDQSPARIVGHSGEFSGEFLLRRIFSPNIFLRKLSCVQAVMRCVILIEIIVNQ